MSWSRRRVLTAGGVLAGVSAMGLSAGAASPWRARGAAGGADAKAGKRIALINLHTAERLDIEYSRGGTYVPGALSAIETCLRDFRTGERHTIDPRLMDYLVDVARAMRVNPAFSVISGYRSPRTNERLRERSNEVSKHSLHMEGRAIDVRLADVDCADLATHAQTLSRGGVGYYRASDFVHLDTGAFRTWRG